MKSLRLVVVFLYWALKWKVWIGCISGEVPEIIENLYVPRFCHAVTARIITISDDYKVAAVGGMILGDVYDCDEGFQHASNGYCVEFRGELALPSGQCDYSVQQTENGRHLDIKHDGRYWYDAMVYFEISDGYEPMVETAIRAAIWLWSQSSPARFEESSTAKNRLVFTPVSDSSCVSYVGKIGGAQPVAIDASGSCNYGSVMHEIGHAIGFYHEHTRPDRENYITINEGSIIEGYTSNYDEIAGGLYAAHDYDFGSVMHYPVAGFSNNGDDVIEVKSSEFYSFLDKYPNEMPEEEVGQRYFLSTIDKTMGYTYLQKCVDGSSGGSYEWSAGPWGGCEPQCNVSYHQRVVFCRNRGNCVDDSECDPTTRPASRKPCELTRGTNITFEETNIVMRGFPMQNVPYYDQFDWIIWQGYPPVTENDGKTLLYDSNFGPGTDADGNADGHYIWVTSQDPTKRNDNTYWESPIVATTNEVKCEVTFSFMIAGRRGRLRFYVVPCSDCNAVEELWWSTLHVNEWTTVTVEIPEYPDDDVRVRFLAYRGVDGAGEFGLDNIYFSDGCVRSEYPELDSNWTMQSPYVLDPDCVYIAVEGWTWGRFEIAMTCAGCVVFLCMVCCLVECILRCRKWYRVKRGIKDIDNEQADAVAKHHKARQYLKKFHMCSLFTDAFHGVYERYKNETRAFKAAYHKTFETQHNYEKQQHRNKGASSANLAVQDETHIPKSKIMRKLERVKHKCHHFAEKSGFLDRVDQVSYTITCGKINTRNPWHLDTHTVLSHTDRRSVYQSSNKNLCSQPTPTHST